MRTASFIVFCWIIILGSGCSSIATRDHATVFKEPARFAGQRVEVCGRFRGGTSNIFASVGKDHGLSILSNEETAILIFKKFKSQKSACLHGTIEYLGCETHAKIICVDSAFDYAIRVEEVR